MSHQLKTDPWTSYLLILYDAKKIPLFSSGVSLSKTIFHEQIDAWPQSTGNDDQRTLRFPESEHFL